MPDVPSSIAWYDSNVYVGFKKEYNILNDRTGDVTEFGLRETGNALIKYMPNKEVLLSTGALGVYFDVHGNPAQRDPFGWDHPPTAIGKKCRDSVASCCVVYTLTNMLLLCASS